MTSGVFPGYEAVLRPPPATPTPLRTDMAGFAGATVRGPAGVVRAVDDTAEFEQVFGQADSSDAGLSDAVRGYFENGGRRAYIARVLGAGARPAKPATSVWRGVGGGPAAGAVGSTR